MRIYRANKLLGEDHCNLFYLEETGVIINDLLPRQSIEIFQNDIRRVIENRFVYYRLENDREFIFISRTIK